MTKNSQAEHLDLRQSSSLGEFLRSHRERLSPQALGLAVGPRRRTPGLRREEVAQLCGVSATWYTWIEQGRPVSASAEALARIAAALQLTGAERAYLFELANLHDPELKAPGKTEVPPILGSLLESLKTPAYILDRQWNAVAWNQAARKLFVGWLNTVDTTPNLLNYIFLASEARELIAGWDERARRVVAEFRADSNRYIKEEPTRALIAELSTRSAEFRRFWRSQDVFEREGGLREFRHPQRGHLVYEQLTLKPSSHEDLKVVILSSPVPEKKS